MYDKHTVMCLFLNWLENNSESKSKTLVFCVKSTSSGQVGSPY